MNNTTEIQHSTTVELGKNSLLYSYTLTGVVSLTIPGNHQISIHFTPAQLPDLESIITSLKLIEKQQRQESIKTLSEKLQQLSEAEAISQKQEMLSDNLKLVPESNGHIEVSV